MKASRIYDSKNEIKSIIFVHIYSVLNMYLLRVLRTGLSIITTYWSVEYSVQPLELELMQGSAPRVRVIK